APCPAATGSSPAPGRSVSSRPSGVSSPSAGTAKPPSRSGAQARSEGGGDEGGGADGSAEEAGRALLQQRGHAFGVVGMLHELADECLALLHRGAGVAVEEVNP